ncbi:hypothetical protein N7490_000593 [Penicillium lividum]|nr:hypothetical protein N7490_000593 [Penicillium lividum]
MGKLRTLSGVSFKYLEDITRPPQKVPLDVSSRVGHWAFARFYKGKLIPMTEPEKDIPWDLPLSCSPKL